MKKIFLVALLVAFASAATVTTYSSAFAGGKSHCITSDDDDAQGNNDCQGQDGQ